jgi:hypothetical protein
MGREGIIWGLVHNMHFSPNIIRVNKSRGVRWAGLVLGREVVHTGLSDGNLRERDHLEDLGADGRIILKYIFKI